MRHTSSISALMCVTLGALVTGACARPDNRMYRVGPDVTADLIVYFKSEATHDQIESFSDNVVGYPELNGGTGHYVRPGVHTVGRVPSVEGHEGISVNFFPNATPAERANLRSRVDGSPLVFVVLENVAPDTVKTLGRR